jgi:hypothetical protein
MILAKTSAGQQVLKDRSVPLTQRQRAALILVDGKRSIDEVLKATEAAGVARPDIEHLLQHGLVESPAPPADLPRHGARSMQERYAAAYPVAARLTASLGLRGFRLNLAVEAAGSYEDLLALAPRIRAAVGADHCLPLDRALRG